MANPITPAGGSVSSGDGLTLTVPAGAVAQNTWVTMTPQSNVPCSGDSHAHTWLVTADPPQVPLLNNRVAVYTYCPADPSKHSFEKSDWNSSHPDHWVGLVAVVAGPNCIGGATNSLPYAEYLLDKST